MVNKKKEGKLLDKDIEAKESREMNHQDEMKKKENKEQLTQKKN